MCKTTGVKQVFSWDSSFVYFRFLLLIQPSPQANDPLASILPSPLLIVEDEPAMQLRLRSILGRLGYGNEALSFAGSIADANAIMAMQPFAMVLVDVGLPDGNGIDLIRDIYAADATLPILVISTWSTEQTIVRAFQVGATGYILKDRDDFEIELSIRSVLRGGAPIDPFVAKHILQLIELKTENTPQEGVPAIPLRSPLSKREIEILKLVSKGLANLEISNLLLLSRSTVECHIKNTYKKLAVNSRTQAIFEARAQGWLS
jgi:DNA-binding NarL/FixJ family response regulator